MSTDCLECGAYTGKAHAANCPNKRVPLRDQLREVLSYGPQTMPGLVAALERPQATINNVLFAMVRDGEVRRAKAFTTHGRDRCYYRPRFSRGQR